VGALTTQRIHDDFNDDVERTAKDLAERVRFTLNPSTDEVSNFQPNLTYYVAGKDAVARVVNTYGRVVRASSGAQDLGPPVPGARLEINGFIVEAEPIDGPFYVQYARPIGAVEATVRRVRLFLVGGVIGGAGLALLAGLMIAKRAMQPITELTETAREIQRTRDPSRRIPVDGAEDEVAELARTLDGMLLALTESRAEQDAMLRRQREFVADASHELRTPLTSVLANLELLVDTLEGEQGEAARSALRSSHRMRRLVQDLLLLARADAHRVAPHEPLDLGQVLVEAASELEPVAGDHDLVLDARHAAVDGARDELHRLALNLMENAIKHTPDGTRIRAAVGEAHGNVVLTVEDDGPGIPPELHDKVFERFVRGAGDRGGSFGLGLSIVRAVAESHGGRVELEHGARGQGTRFVVTLPAAPEPGATPRPRQAAPSAAA